MTIETKYNILDRIKIIALDDMPARIISVKFDGHLCYNVEYWMNGEIKSCWLFEDELSK